MTYNKYHNRKSHFAGMDFDSRLEMERYLILLSAQKEGKISDLRCQVTFEIVPRMKLDDGRYHWVAYIADFVYTKDGEEVIEDTKGYITPEFAIKRLVLLHFKNKKIRIVKHSTEEI